MRHEHTSSNLDQKLDQSFQGPLDFFAHKLELPLHVEVVVGQDFQEQPTPIGGQVTATRLVPPQSALALFDTPLNIAAPVVNFDCLFGRQLGLVTMTAIRGKSSPAWNSILATTLTQLRLHDGYLEPDFLDSLM